LWAGQRNLAEAARHWQKVRALAAQLPESAEIVRLVLEASREILNAAWRIGMQDTEAEVLFADARALAERAGDRRSLALLENFYGTIKFSQGDVPGTGAHCFEAARLAEQTGDPILIGTMQDMALWAHTMRGRLAVAEDLYTRGIALLGNDPKAGTDFTAISPLLA